MSKLNEMEDLPPLRNYLNNFSVEEIVKPLSLTEQDKLANQLLQKIFDKDEAYKEKLKLPDHLEPFRKHFDPPTRVKTKLPIMSQLSPRTKGKIALLPKPNDYDLQELHKLEKLTKQAGGKRAYEELKKEVTPAGQNPLLFPNPLPSTVEAFSKQKHILTPAHFNPPAMECKTTEYYDTIERNKRRKQQQQAIMTKLFRQPITDSVSLMLEAKDETKGVEEDSLDGIEVQVPLDRSPAHRLSKVNSSANLILSPQSSFRAPMMSKTMSAVEFSAPPATLTAPNGGEKKRANKLQQSALQNLVTPGAMANVKPLSSVDSVVSQSTISSLTSYQPSVSMGQREKHREYLNQFSAQVYKEMGIHLNSAFNSVFHKEKAIEILLFYWYLGRLRSGMKQWHLFTEHKKQLSLRKAAKTVIKFVRHLGSWNSILKRDQLLRLQRQAELDRQLAQERRLASMRFRVYNCIFRFVRLRKLRRYVRQKLAAISIQKLYRGYKGREIYRRILHAIAIRKAAAVRIQCMIRCHQATKRVMLVRKFLFIEEYITALQKRRDYAQDAFRVHGAQGYIAKLYRTFVIKKRLQNILYWHRYFAVIKIQKIYRGYTQRKQFQVLKRNHFTMVKQQQDAAITIQCFYRQFAARQALIQLIQKKEEMKLRRRKWKKIKLLQEKSLLEKLHKKRKAWYAYVLGPFYDQKLEKYATKIQKLYRGYHARQRMHVIRVKDVIAKFVKEFRRQEAACIRVQKVFRGHLTRRKLKEKNKLRKLLILQCAFRVHLSKKRLAHLRLINKRSQQITTFIKRRILQYRFHVKYSREQMLGSVIITIQSFYRQWKARNYVNTVLRPRKRIAMETLVVYKMHMIRVLAAMQMQLFIDTVNKPINTRYAPVLSNEDCVCYGPLQALFTILLCGMTSKNRQELSTIHTNNIENQRLVKFCQTKIPLLIAGLGPMKFELPGNNGNSSSGNGNNTNTTGGNKGTNKKGMSNAAAASISSASASATSDTLSTAGTSGTSGVASTGSVAEVTIDIPKEKVYGNGILLDNHPCLSLVQYQKDQYYLRYVFMDITPPPSSSTAGNTGKHKGNNNTVSSNLNTKKGLVGGGKMMKTAVAPKTNKAVAPSKGAGGGGKKSNNTKNGNTTSANATATAAAAAVYDPFQSLPNSALLTMILNHDIHLPLIQQFVTTTEIDIMYNRSKHPKNSSNRLSYEEFLVFLENLSQVQYPSLYEQHANGGAGSPKLRRGGSTGAGMMNGLLKEHEVASSSSAPTSTIATIAVAGSKPGPLKRGNSKLGNTQMTNKSIAFKAQSIKHLVCDLHELSTMVTPTTSISLVNASGVNTMAITPYILYALRIMFHNIQEDCIIQIFQWLEKESFTRLSYYIVKIQSFARILLAKKIYTKKLFHYQQQKKYIEMIKKVIRVQSRIRQVLQRRKIQTIASNMIVKYIPPLQPAYYYNPITAHQSYTKPKILGCFECQHTIPLPPTGLENIVYCYLCTARVAHCYCVDCEDSMCKICFDSLHSRGNRKHHSSVKIPYCYYCKFQMATRSCLTCLMDNSSLLHGDKEEGKKPPAGAGKESKESKAQQKADEKTKGRSGGGGSGSKKAKHSLASVVDTVILDGGGGPNDELIIELMKVNKMLIATGVIAVSSVLSNTAMVLQNSMDHEKTKTKQQKKKKKKSEHGQKEQHLVPHTGGGAEGGKAGYYSHDYNYYCDTCFFYKHDHHTKYIQTLTPEKQSMFKHFYTFGTQQAYVLKTYQPIPFSTTHQYEKLTQWCEECGTFSANWHCFTCQQVYCHSCLMNLHQSNVTFAKHNIEMLSYYTPQMHISLTKDIASQIFHSKWEKCCARLSFEHEQYKIRCAIRVQAWWRRFFYGSRGRKYMQKQRIRLRKMWKIRKSEDQKYRSQWSYQWKDLWGAAPILLSDRKDEIVLKQLNLWKRKRAKEYITKNLEEFGYDQLLFTGEENYRPARKGNPRRSFQVGELEELIDQATNGGYRYPGKVFVKRGENVFLTSYDLSPFLRMGEIVRIQNYYFGIVSFDTESVRVNRLWRGATTEEKHTQWLEKHYYSTDIVGSGGGEEGEIAEGGGKSSKGDGNKSSSNQENNVTNLIHIQTQAILQRMKEKRKAKRIAKTAKKAARAATALTLSMSNDVYESEKKVDEGNEQENEEDEDDDDEEADGEVMYRVPTYRDEKGFFYHRMKFKSFDWTLGNPVVQLGIHGVKSYNMQMLNWSLYFMKSNKRNKNLEDALQWKQAAVRYADTANALSNLITTKEALIDLSVVHQPPDLVEQLEKMQYQKKQKAKKQAELLKQQKSTVFKMREMLGTPNNDEEEDEDGMMMYGEDGEEDVEEVDQLVRAKSRTKKRGSSPAAGGGGGGSKPSSAAGRRSRASTASVVPVDHDGVVGDDFAWSDIGSNKDVGSEFGDELHGDEDIYEDEDEDGDEEGVVGVDGVKSPKRGSSPATRSRPGSKTKANANPKGGKGGSKPSSPDAGGKGAAKLLSSLSFKLPVSTEPQVEEVKIAKKNVKNAKYKSSLLESKPEKPWYATKQQELERRDREDKMSPQELALEAADWKESIDPYTENIFYINIYTNEMMTVVPRAILAKKQVDFENSKNKRSYETARARIKKMEDVTKNRLLMTGIRKR